MRPFFPKGNFDVLEKVASLFDRTEKLRFAGVIAAALVAALFEAMGVVSVLPFVELVMDPNAVHKNQLLNLAFVSLGFESALSFTMAVGFTMLGILVIGNFVAAAADWLKIRFVWQKSHRISSALLQTYLAMPYVYFLNKHSADLSKNIVFEVHQLTSQLLMPLLQIFTKGIMVVVILALLFFVHPAVALGSALVFGSVYVATFLFLQNTLRVRGAARLQENAGRFTAAAEALAGIKDIKALGREREFFERFSRHSDRFARHQAWTRIAMQLPRYLMEIVAFGGVIVLILLLLGLRQESVQIIPLVSFFALAGYRLMPALQIVFHSASEIQFNRAILDRIVEDLRGGLGWRVATQKSELPAPLRFKDRVSLEGVSFSYPYAEEVVLQGINLEIPKGSFIGFAGPTGGGKTTLIDILIGLFVPQEGNVKVDGVELGEANIRNWRRNVGYVPQQIFLSDDTIAHNVAFGLPEEQIDRHQLEVVCTIANLHDFIVQELPRGYDTVIGERGVRLSGGQRQRIGIARALYHDPEVLVFDEATSSLDGTTERAVLEAIEGVSRFKTIIIVAHRLSTLQQCDMIYFVEKGRITAQGTYGKLLDASPSFRAMAQEPERQ